MKCSIGVCGRCGVLVGVLLATGAALAGTFAIGEKDFLLDGQPFVIRSGEMHYPRVPRGYWGHRLKMIRALGLNTVSTYLFWSEHERRPGQFDFTGNLDVAEFCRVAQQEGLKVIVRPGPYVCAEWDMGGLPAWLLKDREVRLRTRDPRFLEPTRRYFKAVGEQLAPLQVTKGGPILMAQVENEYGDYGGDKAYLGVVRDGLQEVGFEVPFFVHEMGWSAPKTVRDDIFHSVGFSGEADKRFQALRLVQPKGPLLCMEFYWGWFDSWARRRRGPGDYSHVVKSLAWMLENGASFNIYLVHGGTTFGFQGGANGPPYVPQLTSYDWDAPISEAGWETPKYGDIRQLMAKHLPPGERLPEVPARNPVIRIPAIELSEAASVWDHLPKPKKETRPRNMEVYDQAHGCILYRIKLPKGRGERLTIRQPHDYCMVFIDGKLVGTVDRSRKQDALALPAREQDATLDLLVEEMGRIDFGNSLADRKGITERVDLMTGAGAYELTGWEVFNLPLADGDLKALKFEKGKSRVPAFFRAEFNLKETGDTFLDLRSWGKGVVWVNGRNLGRFWSVGPQQTLYCPGPWLKNGRNELIVLELTGARERRVAGLAEPILDRINPRALGELHRQPGQTLDLSGVEPVQTGGFPPGDGWQTVKVDSARGRYLCLEALSAQKGDEFTACAELSLLGPGGQELPREGWKIVYADSEETEGEDGRADNVLDGDAKTFWHTQWDAAKAKPPHHVVIDLGREETITGLRYLPRQDGLPNGRIREFRVYVSAKPFPGL
jgi:beta-galactosidase